MKVKAYVLGVDPGSAMGVALLDPHGRRVLSAQLEMKDAPMRTRIVATAVDLAVRDGVDLLVARERWQAGGKHMNPATAAGLGAAWGLWLEQLQLVAPFLPSNRIHAYYPSTWRSRVLGAAAKSKAGWETIARNYVLNRFGLADVGPDEVVGLCVACCVATDPKAVKTVQDRPRWHALVTEGESAAVIRARLEAAEERVRQLERVVAQGALDQSIGETDAL